MGVLFEAKSEIHRYEGTRARDVMEWRSSTSARSLMAILGSVTVLDFGAIEVRERAREVGRFPRSRFTASQTLGVPNVGKIESTSERCRRARIET